MFSKWLHILAVISWMAGVLYLLRLFVYHREEALTCSSRQTLLKMMEVRLYRYITVPAMCITWGSGLAMLHLTPGFLSQSWLHLKVLTVLLLSIVTLWAGCLVREAQRGGIFPERFSGRKLRFANEIPTLLMAIIVALVLFKPLFY